VTGILDAADALEELRIIEVGCVPEVDYSDKPNEWLTDYLAEYAWKIQRDIWQSVAHNRSTAVLSCNNSGKTWLAARIVVWWILTHWRHGVRVVTTAPTAAQVSLLLWQEIRAAYNRAKALGKPVPGPHHRLPVPAVEDRRHNRRVRPQAGRPRAVRDAGCPRAVRAGRGR
jgi:hypothetical protein